MPKTKESPTIIEKTEQNPLPKFLEPALIVAFITAELYVIGYQSGASFFDRLGYDHLSLDLPPNFYLSLSIQPIFLILVTIAVPYMGHVVWRQHTRFLKLAWQLPFILVAGAFTYEAAKHFPSPQSYQWVVFAILLFSMVVVFLRQSENLGDTVSRSSQREKIILLIMFIFFSYLFASIWGEQSATRLIESDLGTVSLEFTWKNLPPPEIQGKDLVLVIHRDQKYFVVAHEKPAPEHPNFYTIPDDLVDLVTTRLR